VFRRHGGGSFFALYAGGKGRRAVGTRTNSGRAFRGIPVSVAVDLQSNAAIIRWFALFVYGLP
jgi:hypothetical protein